MNKFVLISILLVLAGCSPAKIQRTFITTDAQGQRIFHGNGYTDCGETAKGDGAKYLKQVPAMQESCQGQKLKIIRLDEWPNHNGVCSFLRWDGEGQCMTEGKAADEDASEK